jgi:hypothetical protein
MILLSEIWATRNLPEAFYTPRLVDTRPMGSGSHEHVVQFAAVPDDQGGYSVKRFVKSLAVHEGGGKPVVFIIDTGLDKAEAQQTALANLAVEHEAALRRHADYADQNRFRIFFRHEPPPSEGVRWLTIREDDHAMATPPYPVPPRPAFDRTAFAL